MKISAIFLLILITVMVSGFVCADPKPVIAIQPLGSFDTDIIDTISAGIQNLYNVDVVILSEKEMPQSAYYKSRNRYRAEKLLDYLEENVDSKFTKVIGLTNRDISTTKGEYYDWGIFGLGSLAGRTCVVSTYRLGKDKVSDSLFIERLKKVVNHELGHTFGLNHCPYKGCLMEDAKGKIKTVDSETGAFCPDCKEKLKELIK